MATLAQLETLSTAHSAFARVGAFETAPREHIRASNRLFDACVEAGMAMDEADHQAWAAARVVRFLVEA